MQISSVSVIIPTRGRDECVRQTLKDLYEQIHEGFEISIWLVDQNEKKLTDIELPREGVHLNHHHMKPEGSHAGRNYAIFKTTDPLCIFVDDDVRVPPTFVQAHVQAHGEYLEYMNKVVCIAGRVVQPRDGLDEKTMLEDGKLAKYNRLSGTVTGNFFGFEKGLVDHMHECNFSCRTKALREAGAFNEEFKGNAYFEGTDLSLRLQGKGYKIMYHPEIVLTHLQEVSGGNRVQQKAIHTYWYMRNLSLLNSRHMNKIGLPYFEIKNIGYILGKTLKNRNPSIAAEGFKGLLAGLKYFLK